MTTHGGLWIRCSMCCRAARDRCAGVVVRRCYMHAFALVMGSILAHPWARQVVVDAQRVVTLFRASHMPLGVLKEEAKRLGITTTLQTSNQTRLTSSFLCLESVLKMERAFKSYMLLVPGNRALMPATQSAVRNVLEDNSFWAKLKVVTALLEPFTKVVMAVQRNTTSLADITRYWLYLNLSVRDVLPSIPDNDYRRHVLIAFNRRAVEMDSQLSRLALFLDPRYKKVASNDASFKAIMVEVRMCCKCSHALNLAPLRNSHACTLHTMSSQPAASQAALAAAQPHPCLQLLSFCSSHPQPASTLVRWPLLRVATLQSCHMADASMCNPSWSGCCAGSWDLPEAWQEPRGGQDCRAAAQGLPGWFESV